MRITKTPLMYELIGEAYNETIKMVLTDNLSRDTIQKLVDSGLYAEDEYGEGELSITTQNNLSVGIFETMPSPIDDYELPAYVETYFRMNGMWPMEKSPSEIAEYSLNVALPEFVRAGLLETS